MAMTTCPKCGRPRDSYLRYCRSCGDARVLNVDGGTALDPHPADLADTAYCWRCGAHRDAGFLYCAACGLQFEGPIEQTIAGPGPVPQVTPTMSRAQYAQTARAMQNLGIATRVFGCLGMIVGLFMGALLGGVIAPQQPAVVLVLALLIGPIVGAFAGYRLGLSWWASRG